MSSGDAFFHKQRGWAVLRPCPCLPRATLLHQHLEASIVQQIRTTATKRGGCKRRWIQIQDHGTSRRRRDIGRSQRNGMGGLKAWDYASEGRISRMAGVMAPFSGFVVSAITFVVSTQHGAKTCSPRWRVQPWCWIKQNSYHPALLFVVLRLAISSDKMGTKNVFAVARRFYLVFKLNGIERDVFPPSQMYSSLVSTRALGLQPRARRLGTLIQHRFPGCAS